MHFPLIQRFESLLIKCTSGLKQKMHLQQQVLDTYSLLLFFDLTLCRLPLDVTQT